MPENYKSLRLNSNSNSNNNSIMQTFLKVTSVQNKSDKNNRPFQTVTFSEIQYDNGEKFLTAKSRTRNLWSTTPEIKGDALFGQVQVGTMVAGSIQSFNTTVFNVDGRDVNKTTVVVFDGENPVTYANSQLKRNSACVVDEHGQPTATFSVPVPAVKEVNSIFDGFEPIEEEEEVEAAN